MHKKLLVVLSLFPAQFIAGADDQHKQPSGRSGKVRHFVARAYSAGRLTATGAKPTAGVTIAADPKILPMGSRVWVSNAGSYTGAYQVEDVGPGIKGRTIDIYVRSHGEAIQFGRRQVAITLLEAPAPKRSTFRRT